MSEKNIFISIQLNSNSPDQLLRFFNGIERTSTRPEQIEILINIDKGDTIMRDLLEKERQNRPFQIKYIETLLENGFADLWKPLNDLFKLTDKNAYFVINVSDEFIFETKGWDDIVSKYKNYYKDDIFRLRASKYRFRNYTDVWECGYAPDVLAFYTRKWLEICGGWCPCLGPDSFQQCVSFYLFTSDSFKAVQYNRDIPEPELRFSGEGVSIGLSGELKDRRTRQHVKSWMILMSYDMQREALRRAMLLKAHIIAEQKVLKNFQITDNKIMQQIVLLNIEGDNYLFSYRLSRLKIFLVNNFRKLFYQCYVGRGKGEIIKNLFRGTIFYLWATNDSVYRLITMYREAKKRYGIIRWLSYMALYIIKAASKLLDYVVNSMTRVLYYGLHVIRKIPGLFSQGDKHP